MVVLENMLAEREHPLSPLIGLCEVPMFDAKGQLHDQAAIRKLRMYYTPPPGLKYQVAPEPNARDLELARAKF